MAAAGRSPKRRRVVVWPTKFDQLSAEQADTLGGLFKTHLKDIEQNRHDNALTTPPGKRAVQLTRRQKDAARGALGWTAADNTAITALFASYRQLRRANAGQIMAAARERDRRGRKLLARAIFEQPSCDSQADAARIVATLHQILGNALSGTRCQFMASQIARPGGMGRLWQLQQLYQRRLDAAAAAAAPAAAAPAAAAPAAAPAAPRGPAAAAPAAPAAPATAPTSDIKCRTCKRGFNTQRALNAHGDCARRAASHCRQQQVETALCTHCKWKRCTSGHRLQTHEARCKGITSHVCKTCKRRGSDEAKKCYFVSAHALTAHSRSCVDGGL